MDVSTHPDYQRHENVVFANDPDSGLKAIIAIHSTVLGPAAGGCRIWSYASEMDAVADALRLSRGMTYKNAIAGLDLGGGKSVIMLQSGQQKTKAMMRAFGRAVEGLGGDYYVAEDVGSTTQDMAAVRTQTRYVAGLSEGEFASGNPSPITARGVFEGIKLACTSAFGVAGLDGLRFAVQGVGHVGWKLCEMLHASGGRLIVCDVNQERCRLAAERFGAEICSPAHAHAAQCDVYVPCALGGILNQTSIPEIRARVVAGAANNQLGSETDADLLQQAGILYMPDFLINAGGILSVAAEITKVQDKAWVDRQIGVLVWSMSNVLKAAGTEDRSPHHIAMAMAEKRLTETKSKVAEMAG